jgi:hypothetical protein
VCCRANSRPSVDVPAPEAPKISTRSRIIQSA